MEDFYFLPGTLPPSLISPDEERTHRGSEQQAAFEPTKIPVKQIKALGIFQAGLPFELDVSYSGR